MIIIDTIEEKNCYQYWDAYKTKINGQDFLFFSFFAPFFQKKNLIKLIMID